jgi:hypothetical protein
MKGERFFVAECEDAVYAISQAHRAPMCSEYKTCLDVASKKWGKDYMTWTCRGCPLAAGKLKGRTR